MEIQRGNIASVLGDLIEKDVESYPTQVGSTLMARLCHSCRFCVCNFFYLPCLLILLFYLFFGLFELFTFNSHWSYSYTTVNFFLASSLIISPLPSLWSSLQYFWLHPFWLLYTSTKTSTGYCTHLLTFSFLQHLSRFPVFSLRFCSINNRRSYYTIHIYPLVLVLRFLSHNIPDLSLSSLSIRIYPVRYFLI